MQPQGMTITLRPRSPWEATDLGISLVRAHAGRIFAAWCLVTLPAWIAFNALGWAVGAPWIALPAMWWLKPLFDRVPLYAISRAVFGRAPSLREIVRAQFTWGWRGSAPWLLWRRLHFGRLLLLPVDLLEQAHGEQRSERVRVLTRGSDAGPRHQLVVLGAEFELVLSLALLSAALMFVPTPFLPDATASLFRSLFENPPPWAQVALNACVWFGTSLVEPFVVGAGFGLYLNRRVQLEAWDIEHAFRRMAARLSRGAQLACLLPLLILGGWMAQPAMAVARPCPTTYVQTASPQDDGDDFGACPGIGKDKPVNTSLPTLLGKDYRGDGARFTGNLQRAIAGLNRSERDWRWDWTTKPDRPKEHDAPEWVRAIADFVALIARYWLWILAALVLAFVLYHHKTWLRWLGDALPDEEAPAPIERNGAAAAVVLPDDVPSAVRALWQRGEQRAALALLYQAAVKRLSDRLDAPLPPGATEGECLARSRRLNDRRYAGLFARIVQCWQAAAYARRLPATEQLEVLLVEWNPPPQVPA